MMRSSPGIISVFLSYVFFVHDALTDVLAFRIILAKRVLLFLAALSLGILVAPFRDAVARDMGELAANILLFILFLSPLSVIFRAKLLLLLMSLRRELGILMGALALVHGLTYLVPLVRAGVSPVSPTNPFLLSGVLALLLTIPLLLTSNNISTRLLGRNWKRLHRLVYLVLFFAVVHRYFAVGGGGFAFAQAVFLLGSYGAVKFLAFRPALFPPLSWVNAFVASRYAAYKSGLSASERHVNHIARQ